MKYFLLLLLLCGTTLHAQQATYMPANELEFSLGFTVGKWADEHYAPIAYKLGGLPLQLEYARYTRHGHQWAVGGQAQIATLFVEGNDALESSLLDLRWSVAWRWQLLDRQGLRIWAGPAYEMQSQRVDWEQEDGFSTALAYQNTQHFSADLQAVYQLGDWSFGAALEMPLLAYNKRPAYQVYTDLPDNGNPLFYAKGGTWQLPDDYLAPEASVALSYRVSHTFSLRLQYEWQYTEFKTARRSLQRTQQLNLGFNFKF